MWDVYQWKEGRWILSYGKETFFNSDDEMITHETRADALDWMKEHGYDPDTAFAIIDGKKLLTEGATNEPHKAI